jgi:hypothetical protein
MFVALIFYIYLKYKTNIKTNLVIEPSVCCCINDYFLKIIFNINVLKPFKNIKN